MLVSQALLATHCPCESEGIKVSGELHVNKMYIHPLADMSSQLSQRWSSEPQTLQWVYCCGVGCCGEWIE